MQMQFTCCTTINIKETEPTKCRLKNYITLMERHTQHREKHTHTQKERELKSICRENERGLAE
jgi:hypothetical protein